MMANSARDPYWQAGVRRETIDHPTHAAEIQDECAACHMPMAQRDRARGRRQGRGVRAPADRQRRSIGAAAPRRRRRLVHGLPSDRAGQARHARAASTATSSCSRRRADGARAIFGPYADRRRPHDDHALGDRLRAGRGAAHQAVRAVRVVPHADHRGVRARTARSSARCPSR